jgi:hypothetical protein
MINLTDLFPYRKSLTDIVSYATDSFAAVDSKVFASLPADVECGMLSPLQALHIPAEMIFLS